MNNNEKKYRIISVFSYNVDIALSEKMDYKEALGEFEKIKMLNDPEEGINCFIFLIEGDIVKTNNNNLEINK